MWLTILCSSGEKVILSALERFIKLHPTSPALDYALYLQGLVNFNDNLGLFGNLASQDLSERDQQASRDSYQSFHQLIEQFPQSTYAEDARVRMSYIVNSLAAYEVHVARYYYRRGAFVAAANRAEQTVHEFQQSPSTEEALSILAESYDRLGLTELRDDADRVLKTNFRAPTIATDGWGGEGRRPGGSLVSAGARRRPTSARPRPFAAAQPGHASARPRTRVICGNAARAAARSRFLLCADRRRRAAGDRSRPG